MTQKETYNRIEYIVSCVGEFAMQNRLTNAQSYLYLKQFGGIEFLTRFYEAEHLLSIDDAVVDLKNICLRNGGSIA